MKFRRRQIETFCTYITYQLTLLLAIIFVFTMLIEFFDWEFIPSRTERIIWRLVIPALGIILAASAGLSLWLNFSLLSTSIEAIAAKGEDTADGKFQLVVFGKKVLKVAAIVLGCLTLLVLGLNTYDTVQTNRHFSAFKSSAVDPAKINQLTGYLNKLNRNDDFIYKEENCESILADDTCLGYSNIQTLAAVKKILSNMNEADNATFEIYTPFKGQLIQIGEDGVKVEGIFVDYTEVHIQLDAEDDELKKEVINGYTMYSNDSKKKIHLVIIDLNESTKSKMMVSGHKE